MTISHTSSCVVKKKKRNKNNNLAILPNYDTAVQTIVKREQSNLIDNTICSCIDHCKKRVK